MKNVLIKLATLMAMAHMSLGCAWHHGLGHASCESDEAGSAAVCEHSREHCHEHDHADNHCHDQNQSGKACHDDQHSVQNCDQHGENAEPENPTCMSDHSPSHNHAGCHDDGCNFIAASSFDVGCQDQLQLYFGDMTVTTFDANDSTQSDWIGHVHLVSAVFALGVRANLLLGVQIV